MAMLEMAAPLIAHPAYEAIERSTTGIAAVAWHQPVMPPVHREGGMVAVRYFELPAGRGLFPRDGRSRLRPPPDDEAA